MRLPSRFWFLLSVICFVAAVWFWLKGNEEEAKRKADVSQKAGNLPGAKVPGVGVGPGPGSGKAASVAPGGSGGNQGTGKVGGAAPPAAKGAQGRFPYRLSNTEEPLSQLGRSETAILLENALIDTASGRPVAVPEPLRAQGDGGSYLVQSRGPLDAAFYRWLREAGAEFVSYIPNNAALVRVSASGAGRLGELPGIRAVLAYEPYYKLAQPLLALAVEHQSLPLDSALNVTLFAGQKEAVSGALEDLGAEVIAEERTPFGPLLTIKAHPDSLVALAQLRGVQRIEYARGRGLLNDLSRVRTSVAADPVTNGNYLGLSGTNVMLNLNDTGVDASHPDLSGRVFTIDTNAFTLQDVVGHGTHVAGTMISSGGLSATALDEHGDAPSGSVTNADFRGKAPAASVYVLPIDLRVGPLISDA